MTFLFTTIEIASDESREEREEKGLCTISLKGLFQTLHILAASRSSSHDMALDLIIYPTCRYVTRNYCHEYNIAGSQIRARMTTVCCCDTGANSLLYLGSSQSATKLLVVSISYIVWGVDTWKSGHTSLLSRTLSTLVSKYHGSNT